MSLISAFILPLILSTFASGARNARQAIVDDSIVYQRFHIDSTIVARYATTSITSVAQNNANVSKELSFQVQLPHTAFISNFSMIVNGTAYIGVAKDKASAAREFEERQRGGENVGLVESRGTNTFAIRINTAASSTSTFILQYEELLIRRLSKYRQTLSLRPGSIVEDFRVFVRAIDEQGIAYFEASDFVTTNRISSEEVSYSFTPSVMEQNDVNTGLLRDMVIEYDVNHPSEGAGAIIVNDCYFAQFFSPSGLSPLPVDIVFVIDISGSMGGLKIAQARQSLDVVISQLRLSDRFSIVTFQSNVAFWMDRPVLVSEHRNRGRQFSQELRAGGGTNFTGGMNVAIDMLKRYGNADYIQLIVMLTDGQPSVGITNPTEIVTIAERALVNTRISLNTLGFGKNLNFQLLERLALSNRGISKRIYEGEDAATQLEGFYEELTSPILHSINVTYPSNAIEDISPQIFPLLFNGSEVVVAGKFLDDICLRGNSPIPVMVRGMRGSGEITFQSQVDPGGNTEIAGVRPSTERLVAYFLIGRLLERARIADDASAASAMRNRSLALALRYNFVTELTSLIVVEESMLDADDNSTDVNANPTSNSPREEDLFGLSFPTSASVGGGGIGGIQVNRGSYGGSVRVTPALFVVLGSFIGSGILSMILSY